MENTIMYIILIALVILIVLLSKKKVNNKKKIPEAPANFWSISDGNQFESIVTTNITEEWLQDIKNKYDWDNFDEYDNCLWEYVSQLFDEPYKRYTEEYPDNRSYDLWEALTREQKVFWTFLAFNGQTDNGGVYQFMFNYPEFTLAAAEAWDELGIKSLQADYQKVLEELAGKQFDLDERREIFNNESISWEKRWNTFSKGYLILKSTEKIEEYYYKKEFKKELYKQVSTYIENNIDKFATLKTQ